MAKKIYKIMQQFRIDGGKWLDTSMFYGIYYCESDEKYRIYKTFDELLKGITQTEFANAWIDYTVFTHKPIARLSTPLRDTRIKITEKNFKVIETRFVYKEWSKCSIADIAKQLPFSDYLEFLKDNDIKFEIGIDK